MEVYINGFTRIKLENINLKRMQIGEVQYYDPSDFKEGSNPIIDVEIKDLSTEPDISTLFIYMFSHDKQGYFSKEEHIYYRDCNLVANTCLNEIFYKGKIPNSKLYIKISETKEDKINMEILATSSFIMESRSRFTKLGSIEDIINDILLFLSVYKGKIPMHCSAVQLNSEDKLINCLLMGLPNTGKTTSATRIASQNKNKLIAEDIAFIDIDNMSIYSAPYTSKTNKSDMVMAGAIDRIILLTYKNVENKMEVLEKDTAVKMIGNMNLYEFNWDKNLILKGLMISGYMNNSKLNQFEIDKIYNESYKKLISSTNCYQISGNSREGWAEMINNM
jgi:hypothetical protein